MSRRDGGEEVYRPGRGGMTKPFPTRRMGTISWFGGGIEMDIEVDHPLVSLSSSCSLIMLLDCRRQLMSDPVFRLERSRVLQQGHTKGTLRVQSVLGFPTQPSN